MTLYKIHWEHETMYSCNTFMLKLQTRPPLWFQRAKTDKEREEKRNLNRDRRLRTHEKPWKWRARQTFRAALRRMNGRWVPCTLSEKDQFYFGAHVGESWDKRTRKRAEGKKERQKREKGKGTLFGVAHPASHFWYERCHTTSTQTKKIRTASPRTRFVTLAKRIQHGQRLVWFWKWY